MPKRLLVALTPDRKMDLVTHHPLFPNFLFTGFLCILYCSLGLTFLLIVLEDNLDVWSFHYALGQVRTELSNTHHLSLVTLSHQKKKPLQFSAFYLKMLIYRLNILRFFHLSSIYERETCVNPHFITTPVRNHCCTLDVKNVAVLYLVRNTYIPASV